MIVLAVGVTDVTDMKKMVKGYGKVVPVSAHAGALRDTFRTVVMPGIFDTRTTETVTTVATKTTRY